MTKADILKMTEINLDILVPVLQTGETLPAPLQNKVDLISFDVDAAIQFITREGITLGTVMESEIEGEEPTTVYTAEDAQLIVMYAAWLYRKRGSANVYQPTDAMPRMLRFALNNRLISEKASVADDA